ncbi:MAG: FecR domain-containing protein [Thermodesulfobacteriota bacterium]
MMNRIIVILGVVLLFGSSWAPAMEIPVGSIKMVKGSAVIVRLNQTLSAKIGENIFKNDSLKTGADGSLGMIFKDDTLLSLGPNSEVVIQEFMFSPGEGKLALVTRMIKGTAAYLTGIITKLAPESVRFETPVGSAGVRGTKFVVKIEE